MKEVYIVTSGEYSDYGINAIFDNEELANKFISLFKDCHDMRIEKYIVNSMVDEIQNSRKPYFMYMDKDGKVEGLKQETEYFYRFDKSVTISFTRKGEFMIVNCWANDEKHAIKIANEKRSQYIAMGIWGNGEY